LDDSNTAPLLANHLNGWRAAGIGLAGVGLADSSYLLAEFLSGQVALYSCPNIGVVNCAAVTSSGYSRFLGVPVALLAVIWFITMASLFVINSASLNPLLTPLWVVGVVFAGYLIFVELFLLHAICPYCTLAHATGMVLGAPSIKLMLA
jgi:uncharacterized membrane protein